MATMRDTIKTLYRVPLQRRMQRQLRSDRFLILSNSCIGGALLHDLGMALDTPTVNLTVVEFDRFCADIGHYLSLVPEEAPRDGRKFPVAILDDVTILCNHFTSFEEFLETWERRKKRFLQKLEQGYEVILVASEFPLYEPEAEERFRALPYRKVCFVREKREYPEFIVVPPYGGKDHFSNLVQVIDWRGRRVFEKALDCVAFLNGDLPFAVLNDKENGAK